MTNSPSAALPAAMLVLTTLFWGASFPLVKNWQEAARDCPGGEGVASFTLIALRMGLSFLLLAAWQPRCFFQPTRREHAVGLVVGLAFFVAFSLQVLGLAHTSPARSAFFTCLGGAWVPIIMAIVFRIRVSRLTIAGIGLAVVGAAVLGIQLDDGIHLGWGDSLTVASSLFFALQIVLLDRLGHSVRSEHITVSLLAITGLLSFGCTLLLAAASPGGIVGWLRWLENTLSNIWVLLDLAALTLFATVLAFHWMNQYQPAVGASRAALIYFLEPVFAAVFSVAWGHDRVTERLIAGGAFILAGNLLVELPGWLRELRSRGQSE